MELFQTLINMRKMVKKVSEDFQITIDEAELIVATLLDRPRFRIYVNNEIDNETATVLKMRLRQLKKGTPIEYITKKVHFMDFCLTIYPGVFIPRLETEYFVELLEKLVCPVPNKILEIGTGCGAIAISLAKVFSEAHISATDISEIALKNASENIQKLGLIDRISLLRRNMFDGLTEKFDLIISNPPYIPSSRIQSLPKSVRDFEPIAAIDGGYGGVRFIKKLIELGKQYLNSCGVMAIEIDEEQVAFLTKFLETNLFGSFIFKKDLFGRFRYLFIGDFKDEKSKNSN